MDGTLKTDWLVALRSKEFKQTNGVLYNSLNDSYCCLGVLAKVAGATFEKRKTDYESQNLPFLNGTCLVVEGDECFTKATKEMFGLSDEEETKLIDMNDIQRKDFDKIADFIEVNL